MTEEANEQGQEAQANPSKVPPPPKFQPDPELMEESLRDEPRREREQRVIWRETPSRVLKTGLYRLIGSRCRRGPGP
jgi:hypothetical protein